MHARGMYMKVLVSLSERIAMTARLTVGDLNTYFSQLWGGFNASDFMPIIEDLVETVRVLPTNAYEIAVSDVEKELTTHHDYVDASLRYLHGGNFQSLLDGIEPFEWRLAKIDKLNKKLVGLWDLQSLATKAENSVEDLQVHISKHLKRNDASGAPTPLGQDFEMILEAAQTAVGAWRAESENSPLAEIKTDLVG